MKVLIGIALAWAAAWAVVVLYAPALWVVAALGFFQNLAFTFVSRGRNSGSLTYHMVAAAFSNGIFIAMFAVGWRIMETTPDSPWAFLAVYTLSTMSGSVFAHWIAKQVERGAARNVQEDRVEVLEKWIEREASRRTQQDDLLREDLRSTKERIEALEKEEEPSGTAKLAFQKATVVDEIIRQRIEKRLDRYDAILEKTLPGRLGIVDETIEKVLERLTALGAEIGLEKETRSQINEVILNRVAELENLSATPNRHPGEWCTGPVVPAGRGEIEKRLTKVESQIQECSPTDNSLPGALDRREEDYLGSIDAVRNRVEALETQDQITSRQIGVLLKDRDHAFRRLDTQLADLEALRGFRNDTNAWGAGLAERVDRLSKYLDPENILEDKDPPLYETVAALEESMGRAFQRLENHLLAIEGLRKRTEGSKAVAGVDGARINVLNRRIDTLQEVVDELAQRPVTIQTGVVEAGEIVGHYETTDDAPDGRFHEMNGYIEGLRTKQRELEIVLNAELARLTDAGITTAAELERVVNLGAKLEDEVVDLHAAIEKIDRAVSGPGNVVLDRIDALERRALECGTYGDGVTPTETHSVKIAKLEGRDAGTASRLRRLEGRVEKLERSPECAANDYCEVVANLETLTDRLEKLEKERYSGDETTPLVRDVVRILDCDLGDLEDRVKELEERGGKP